jgi:hypothetical protein
MEQEKMRVIANANKNSGCEKKDVGEDNFCALPYSMHAFIQGALRGAHIIDYR